MLSVATRGILRYAWMGPCHWLATAISYVVVPFIVLFASEDGWLPKCFSWFQTLDCSLDGDGGWQTEHRPWMVDPYGELSRFERYICRVLWLYRNPVYGFEKTILKADIDPASERYVIGTEGLGDRYSNPPYKTGWNFTAIKNGSGKCYAGFKWFVKLTPQRSFNGMIGWKLLHAGWPRTDTYSAQIVTTIRSTRIFI